MVPVTGSGVTPRLVKVCANPEIRGVINLIGAATFPCSSLLPSDSVCASDGTVQLAYMSLNPANPALAQVAPIMEKFMTSEMYWLAQSSFRRVSANLPGAARLRLD